MNIEETKLTQGTDEWLQWRESGIGASEMSVLMGSLPFSWEDVLELWKKKKKIINKEFVVNEAMQAGIDMEPEARDEYSKLIGYNVTPKCFTHPVYRFLRASLDGICDCHKNALEIKCPGLNSFKKAFGGKVLDYYYTQIQQQMLCSGAQHNDYWVYRKINGKKLVELDLTNPKYKKGIEEGAVLIRVPRNDEYIEEIVRRGSIFWEMFESNKPVLPRHLGINIQGYVDPFKAGGMETQLIAAYAYISE